MKSGLLFVISLTVLAATAATGANAQRGLTASPPADAPSSNMVVAQKDTGVEPGEIFRD